jgi:hypothetical protein
MFHKVQWRIRDDTSHKQQRTGHNMWKERNIRCPQWKSKQLYRYYERYVSHAWQSILMIQRGTTFILHIVINCFIDWLIDYLRFYVPFNIFSLIWRRQHCRWRAANFRLMIGAQGLWAWRDLYRTTPAVTRELGFTGLIRRTAPTSFLLQHTRGCGGSILTRILRGLNAYFNENVKMISILTILRIWNAWIAIRHTINITRNSLGPSCWSEFDKSLDLAKSVSPSRAFGRRGQLFWLWNMWEGGTSEKKNPICVNACIS